MCTQRLHLLIFVWFYIHLLSLISIQCKRYQRKLDQHYLYHQNRPMPHNNPKKLPFQNKKSRFSKLKKDDFQKLKLNSISGWYPVFKFKLNLSFIDDSANSVTLRTIHKWPQDLDNYSLPVLSAKKNIKETSTELDNFPSFLRSNVNEESDFIKSEPKLETSKKRTEIRKLYKKINSTEHGSHPEFHVNNLQSENEDVKKLVINRSSLLTEKSPTSVRTGTTFKVKRSVKNDFLTNNNEPEKKSLLNLDGPSILGDVEHSLDQDNSVHIRVKRDNPNKTNVVPRFKSGYLENLAVSFPKSEHELEEERLASNNVEDERLIKCSSSHEHEDSIDNLSAIKLNSPKFRYEENLGYQQENMDSGLANQILDNRNERKNYAKMHPESFSIRYKLSRSVSQIATDYQKQNLQDASCDCANDNQDDPQKPYQLKLKNNKSEKFTKKKRNPRRKNRKIKLVKMQESLDQLDKVVGDFQI
ncbi:uncharacterized protein LOC117177514 [Belonocnema kinseyi]|uniref:uncharacterized protein LOC117177514 n=1 Tax=Belonocnema kinseyi TaxID=2817044 RepID=UPI00143CDDD9|nr:uncharacterized protein LOC117177514 [Belonocnema kinseyi]